MKKELENFTTQIERDSRKNEDDEDVEWLDEMDIYQKYHGKPSQLKAIMETAEAL